MSGSLALTSNERYRLQHLLVQQGICALLQGGCKVANMGRGPWGAAQL
jgi:hypothetical protein